MRTLTKPWLGPLLRQRAICRALVVVLGVLGIAVLYGINLWPCVFAEFTGLPCPGCGVTRGTLALLRGDWRSALQFHPFTPFFFILGGLVTAGALLPQAQIGRLASQVELFERKTKATIIFLGAVLAFSLLRMLGLWYQPPLSVPAGILFNRKPTVGLPSEPEIKSHLNS